MESRPGVEELAEPEVTTSSGRQTEMRATQIITVITNFGYRETANVSMVYPQTNAVEMGPILDTVTTVLPDGYMISLETTASLTKFLGYDIATNTAVAYNQAGEKMNLPTISPSLVVRRASAHVKLWDGQTVVLGGLEKYFDVGGRLTKTEPDYFVKTTAARGQPDEEAKEVLVFITVTLVDPAGNRLHSDGEMPFADKSVPPQGGL